MAKGKKTGGRQKGTPNKATAFTKEVISDILSDYYSTGQMAKDMKELEPKERVDAILKLAAFVTPKPQSIDMSITSSKKKTIEDTLEELAEENDEA
ncbi:MAG: hypothetical protein IJ155_04515 [Prevotella sp.]|nr:hypothetical protein [Prevotella sp.]